MIDISLIGTGGMIPLHNRFLASFIARLNGSMLLIDCGEGTQVTLKQLNWGFKNLDYICFTHFHADHISGLPGLLLTIGNSGRTKPLTIVGPEGVKNVVNSLRVISPILPFELIFIEIPLNKASTITLSEYKISTLPLNHTINCIGYSLQIDRAGKFDPIKAKQLNIPVNLWSRLQKGETIKHLGKLYVPDMVMGRMRKGIKISYITDTRPIDTIPNFILNSDVFICEGIYGENEKQEKAKEHNHMIFSEAATLAKKGNVKEMWLTHYSPAMANPLEYIQTAKNIFPNSIVGYDRMTKTILFE